MNPAFFPSKHQHPSRRGLQRAFTLIEVMIVVGIVTILAAIAIPSYNEYVIRGRLTNATNTLAAFRADMERHFQDNRTYLSVTSGAVTFPSPCSPGSLATLNATLAAQNVTVACPVWTAVAYTATATGSGSISGFTYGITEANVQNTVAAPSGWTTNPARWCVRKGC